MKEFESKFVIMIAKRPCEKLLSIEIADPADLTQALYTHTRCAALRIRLTLNTRGAVL